MDICCNIRYVDLNGRSGSDPWSFRNFAVLNSYYVTGESNWVLVCVPTSARDFLRRKLEEKHAYPQIFWHAYLMGAVLWNWRHYINFLEDHYQKVVSTSFPFISKLRFISSAKSKTVTLSRYGDQDRPDAALELLTSQPLRSVQTKLQRSLCILQSYSSISNGIEVHIRELNRRQQIRDEEAQLVSMALRQQMDIAVGHIRRLEGLLKSCDFTAQTVRSHSH